jgi:hypothetical protein
MGVYESLVADVSADVSLVADVLLTWLLTWLLTCSGMGVYESLVADVFADAQTRPRIFWGTTTHGALCGDPSRPFSVRHTGAGAAFFGRTAGTKLVPLSGSASLSQLEDSCSKGVDPSGGQWNDAQRRWSNDNFSPRYGSHNPQEASAGNSSVDENAREAHASLAALKGLNVEAGPQHSGNGQGTFEEHLRNIQGTFREHLRNI